MDCARHARPQVEWHLRAQHQFNMRNHKCYSKFEWHFQFDTSSTCAITSAILIRHQFSMRNPKCYSNRMALPVRHQFNMRNHKCCCHVKGIRVSPTRKLDSLYVVPSLSFFYLSKLRYNELYQDNRLCIRHNNILGCCWSRSLAAT